MELPVKQEEIKARECRHVVYCGKPEGTNKDLHLIKETIHTHDGRSIPHVTYKEDFKRDIYVTKTGQQNHNSKKEWEDRVKLDRFETTQSDLDKNIARALKKPYFSGNPRKLRDTPFLYGTDIKSTALIKEQYQRRNKEVATFHSLGVFDTETNVVDGSQHIIMATFSFKDKVVTVVDKRFVTGIANAREKCFTAFQKYLGAVEMKNFKTKKMEMHDLVKERGLNWELIFVDSEIDIVREIFKKAHEYKPDYLTMWNMRFDIEKVLEACERAGVDPANIFSDPSVPYQYKFFNWVPGPSKKVTASGKETPIKPADRWHLAGCPASFYLVDSMCVYRRVRAAMGDEPSFALNAILTKEEMPRKLHFDFADDYEDLEWHIFMQTNYQIEYIIYNVFDCICVELLDEKTKDLAVAMPSRCGTSDFADYKSQPRMAVDDLHFVCLNSDKVIGTVGGQMVEEVDELFNLSGLITNLPAHLITKQGLQCIEEDEGHLTNIYLHVADRL